MKKLLRRALRPILDVVRRRLGAFVDRRVEAHLAGGCGGADSVESMRLARDEMFSMVRQITRSVVVLRREVLLLEGSLPQAEEIRRLARAAATEARAVRLDLEANGASEAARFGFLLQEVSQFKELAEAERIRLAETSERAADALLAARRYLEREDRARPAATSAGSVDAEPATANAEVAANGEAAELHARLRSVETLLETSRTDYVRLSEGLEKLTELTLWDPGPLPAIQSSDPGPTFDSIGFARYFDADEAALLGSALKLVRSPAPRLAVTAHAYDAENVTTLPLAQFLGDAERSAMAPFGAIACMGGAERCAAAQRPLLLQQAVASLESDGTLILAVTNALAGAAWQRFHLDPWKRDYWLPQTWCVAIAAAGFRGYRYYDPSNEIYVDRLNDASGTIFVVAYR